MPRPRNDRRGDSRSRSLYGTAGWEPVTEALDRPQSPPGVFHHPRTWEQRPSQGTVLALVLCLLPYAVSLLIFLAAAIGAVLSRTLVSRLALAMMFAGAGCIILAILSWRVSRKTQTLADRTVAAVCFVLAAGFFPLAGVVIGIIYSISGS